MAAHVRLKNEFTEEEKYHNLKGWLKLRLTDGGAKESQPSTHDTKR